MADPASGAPEPLRFLDGIPDGRCDPSTGVCAVPGTTTAPGTDRSDTTSPTDRAPAAPSRPARAATPPTNPFT
ncbi:hypothetical protein [Streptomyces shenzhenensis]|uniref:hypothetical protein n=1 Tax=Streptomyces shenzhenensis TaxID=943815 RepID=UPI0033CB61BA